MSDNSMKPELSADLTIRDLSTWAQQQSERLARINRTTVDDGTFRFSQAIKLTEEVGELQAEVLGIAGYQRASKGQAFTSDSIGGELADVLICLAILAESHGVDLGKVVAAKIEHIEQRHKDMK